MWRVGQRDESKGKCTSMGDSPTVAPQAPRRKGWGGRGHGHGNGQCRLSAWDEYEEAMILAEHSLLASDDLTVNIDEEDEVEYASAMGGTDVMDLPVWSGGGVLYPANGMLVQHDGVVYECRARHTSNAEMPPAKSIVHKKRIWKRVGDVRWRCVGCDRSVLEVCHPSCLKLTGKPIITRKPKSPGDAKTEKHCSGTGTIGNNTSDTANDTARDTDKTNPAATVSVFDPASSNTSSSTMNRTVDSPSSEEWDGSPRSRASSLASDETECTIDSAEAAEMEANAAQVPVLQRPPRRPGPALQTKGIPKPVLISVPIPVAMAVARDLETFDAGSSNQGIGKLPQKRSREREQGNSMDGNSGKKINKEKDDKSTVTTQSSPL